MAGIPISFYFSSQFSSQFKASFALFAGRLCKPPQAHLILHTSPFIQTGCIFTTACLAYVSARSGTAGIPFRIASRTPPVHHLVEVFHLKVFLSFPSLIFLRDVLALVIELLASCKAYLQLDQASFEVNLQRHDCVPLGRHLPCYLVDFIFVQEELPDPQRILVEDISFFVGADVHVVDVQLPIFHADEGLLDAAFSHSEGFYFCSVKHDAGLKGVFYKVIKSCLFVVCD